jgi:hypothetical protein
MCPEWSVTYVSERTFNNLPSCWRWRFPCCYQNATTQEHARNFLARLLELLRYRVLRASTSSSGYKNRGSSVIAYVTNTRQNLEVHMAARRCERVWNRLGLMRRNTAQVDYPGRRPKLWRFDVSGLEVSQSALAFRLSEADF